MNKFFIAALAVGFMLTSCNGGKKSSSEANSETIEVANQNNPEFFDVELLTNAQGDSLELRFNEDASAVQFVIGQDSVVLREAVKASGMHFANENYELSLWKGVTELKKGDVTLFYSEPILVKGTLSLEGENNLFIPCGEEAKTFQIVDNTENLNADYQALIEDSEKSMPIYAEIKVNVKGLNAAKTEASEFDGTYAVEEVVVLKKLEATDCK